MSAQILSQEEITSALGELPGWTLEVNRLSKEFVFSSFREAVSFIVRLSFEAEQRDHHPEIRNVYNRVWIELSTHDAGNRVTKKDVDLALALEHFCWL